MKPSRQDIYNAVIGRMVHEALQAKHDAFSAAHGQDSDDQLIAYIRTCAHQLGHPPHQKEIIGWPTIIARFGTWSDALRAAKLQNPETPNIPAQFAIIRNETEVQKQLYRERKLQKKLQAQKRLAEQARRKKEHAAR